MAHTARRDLRDAPSAAVADLRPTRSALSRRSVLRGLGLTALGLGTGLLEACSSGGGRVPTGDAGGRAGEAFVTPQELLSAGGHLEVELVAQPNLLAWGDGRRYALTYNGSTPGPTLRVRPGDTLVVHLRNRLDRPTNLHTHGLHVSPAGTADNVFVMVGPGEDRTYEYHLPADHPSGWAGAWRRPCPPPPTCSPCGSARPTRPARGGTLAPATLARLEPLDALAVDARRSVTLGAMGMGSSAFVIDGRGFSADRVDIRVRAGTTEEWTLRNASMMDHPFHLHVWPFRVVARSDGPPDPGWRDTVDVPAGATVTIRIPFRDITGRTVYHCHILDHEDLGMMGVIEVA